MATSTPTAATQVPGSPGFVGPPDPPGTVVVQHSDGSRVRVRPVLLRRYASTAAEQAATVTAEREGLQSARLSRGAFGSAAIAQEVAAAYHTRIEAGLTEQSDLSASLETFGSRLREAADAFEEQDGQAAGQLAFQLGRLRERVICR